MKNKTKIEKYYNNGSGYEIEILLSNGTRSGLSKYWISNAFSSIIQYKNNFQNGTVIHFIYYNNPIST